MRMRAVGNLGLVAGVVAVALGMTAAAETYYFSTGGYWNVNANWNPSTGYPGALDTAIITNSWLGNYWQAAYITLNGNQAVQALRVVGDNAGGWWYWNAASDSLQVGAGGFLYEYYGRHIYSTTPARGTFNAILAGVAPTVKAGVLVLNNANNTFAGSICVPAGEIFGVSDGALGNAGNNLVVGTNGTFGAFGASGGGTKVLARNVVLAGNGGIIRSLGDAIVRVNGTLSGPGRLIFAPSCGYDGNTNNMHWLYGNNTYGGGTLVVAGNVGPAAGLPNNTILGTGEVVIRNSGLLCIESTNNVAAGARVLVANDLNGGLQVNGDTWIPIDTNSYGTLLVGTYVNANTVRTRALADAANPIGNGQMWLGSSGYNRYSVTSLAALVVSDPTHTYKFWGGYNKPSYGTPEILVGSAYDFGGNQGPLRDLFGYPHNVVCGKPGLYGEWLNQRVRFEAYSPFPYSGTTTVNRGTTLDVWSHSAGHGAGATNGPVYLNGFGHSGISYHSLEWRAYFNWGWHPSRAPDVKGELFFNGSTYIALDRNPAQQSSSPGYSNRIQLVFASFNRDGRSTLGVRAVQNELNTGEVLRVVGGLTPTNGMVAPYFWNVRDSEFLDYNADGFKNTTAQVSTLAGAATNAIVHSPGETVPGGGQTIWALRANGAMSGGTLTLGSGGLICSAAATHTCGFNFGNAEGIIYTPANVTLSGVISGSQGLTKSGTGSLTLTANNGATLAGPVTVNEGELAITNDNAVGAGDIILNGGTLNFSAATGGRTCTRNIVLGRNGGIIRAGWASPANTIAGNITGEGVLRPYAGDRWLLSGTANTYSGGTYLLNQTRLIVEATSSLGSGDVVLGSSGVLSEQGSNAAELQLRGDNNVSTNARMILKVAGTFVRFAGPVNPKVGSLEGVGNVWLGKSADEWSQNGYNLLSVGFNNRDADFFGRILDGNYATPCGVCKVGTGTWRLWGENTYAGGTTVSNGVLEVNNRLFTNAWVQVFGPGVLDGIGTVGMVTNYSGTVRGNLWMRRLTLAAASTFEVTLGGTNAGTDYAVLNVTEGLNLGGGALSIKFGGGFVPQVGQSFRVLNNASAGPITGTFAGDRIVSTVQGGKTYYFRVDYTGGDGNDIVLTALPQGTVLYIR